MNWRENRVRMGCFRQVAVGFQGRLTSLSGSQSVCAVFCCDELLCTDSNANIKKDGLSAKSKNKGLLAQNYKTSYVEIQKSICIFGISV